MSKHPCPVWLMILHRKTSKLFCLLLRELLMLVDGMGDKETIKWFPLDPPARSCPGSPHGAPY